jgi:hypothetical protein
MSKRREWENNFHTAEKLKKSYQKDRDKTSVPRNRQHAPINLR